MPLFKRCFGVLLLIFSRFHPALATEITYTSAHKNPSTTLRFSPPPIPGGRRIIPKGIGIDRLPMLRHGAEGACSA